MGWALRWSRSVVLPALNEPQLIEDVPEELRAGMKFRFVRSLEQALNLIFDRRAAVAPTASA